MTADFTASEIAVLADIRRAWWSRAAAARARRRIGELPEARRAELIPLLQQADKARHESWITRLTWLVWFGLASALVPPLIFLGAPHLLTGEDEESAERLVEEIERQVVYLPPPPPEEEPPVLDPEKVTGPVRPTSPGTPGGDPDGAAVVGAPNALGVIAARVDPSVARSTWLAAFAGSGVGGEGGDGSGGGIPEGMIYVPSGTFQMGTVAGVGEPEEHPRHPVQLSPFAIDRDEVSVGAFNRWCTEAPDRCGWTLQDSSSLMADHPVTGVNWYEARAFCLGYGKDLPTEAQWEAAARWNPETGRTGLYPWGNEPPTCAQSNFLGCHNLRTVPLGASRGHSPVGARDMAGNAREWVLDRFGKYPAGKQVDPRGPSSGERRVLRGGSFGGAAEDVRATDRDAAPPELRTKYNGFRCAVPVEGDPPPPEDELAGTGAADGG